jgi:hypothetical protein
MNFEEYWGSLVNRVHVGREELRGDEERFLRLSCIYGETAVDGIEAYFGRRFDEFDADMAALRGAGLSELASEFERARKLLFGSAPLGRETVEATTVRLLDETEESKPVLVEIGKIYQRVIPQLDLLADYKYSFGLAAGLFDDG